MTSFITVWFLGGYSSYFEEDKDYRLNKKSIKMNLINDFISTDAFLSFKEFINGKGNAT